MIKCLITAGAYTSGYLPITQFANTNSKYSVSGNTVLVKTDGISNVKANVIIEATGTTDLTLSLYVNGVAVPGAFATITPAAGNTYTLNINDVIRTVFTDDYQFANVELVLSGACTIVGGDLIMENHI